MLFTEKIELAIGVNARKAITRLYKVDHKALCKLRCYTKQDILFVLVYQCISMYINVYINLTELKICAGVEATLYFSLFLYVYTHNATAV